VVWTPLPNWAFELRSRYFASEDREHENHPAATHATLDVDGSQIWTIDLGVRFNF